MTGGIVRQGSTTGRTSEPAARLIVATMERRKLSERWKFTKVGAASAVAAGVIIGSAAVAAAGPAPQQVGKITLCRATGSMKNPYVVLTVNANSAQAVPQGHRGGVYNGTSKVWGDIIPPHPGLKDGYNWTPEGQAVMGGKCGQVSVTTAPPMPTTTAAPTTTTAPPASTTSTSTMSYVWQQ